VKIPVGGTARVRLDIPAARFVDKLHLEMNEPPEGISIKSFASNREGAEVIFQSSATSKPGTKGNLIVNAFNSRAEPGKEKGKNRRPPVATIPAIAFEVVAALPAK
jgi:hypothetical protein